MQNFASVQWSRVLSSHSHLGCSFFNTKKQSARTYEFTFPQTRMTQYSRRWPGNSRETDMKEEEEESRDAAAVNPRME
ncbi:Hypothetical protein SMAX5B_018519 [Scophthalmus maximus]|uniref:Uncharacterized protein n=1 Tax=Scophthalmus maximus TaxID=52904 RepID=A0A2U9CAC5_SCOMX|nr:Hypothetical protein SMAX5B_018519 [Scophthalmus maximus]